MPKGSGRSGASSLVWDAEMPAGSRVIYLGSTIHGAGSNTTSDQRRPAFHLSYMLGWLRCEENNCLATPPDIARTLPRPSSRASSATTSTTPSKTPAVSLELST